MQLAVTVPTYFVLFQRLDTFNEIPGPLSVSLPGVPSVYFPLDFGRILVEKFVGFQEFLYIDRVFAYTNSIGLCRVDLKLHPNFSKHFGVHSIATPKIVNQRFPLLSSLAFDGGPFQPKANFHHFIDSVDDDLPRRC